MILRHGAALFLIAVVLLGLAPAIPAAPAAEEIHWLSWDAGLREAEDSGRSILVDVYTDWCGWCKRMDRDVYSRADVREAMLSRFVPVKLDAESNRAASYQSQRISERAIAAKFRVKGYPTTVFLSAQGGHLVNVPGYVPPDRFVHLMRYIGDGHFERGVSFDEFVRNAK